MHPTPHVINHLRAMRGMPPVQHFAAGGVAQAPGIPMPWTRTSQPLPWSRRQIRQFDVPMQHFAYGGQVQHAYGHPWNDGQEMLPFHQWMGGQSGQPGGFPGAATPEEAIPTDQPHPGQFSVVGNAPGTSGIPGSLLNPLLPPPPPAYPNTVTIPPQGPDILNAPHMRRMATGGVVKGKKKKMKKVPGVYEPMDPYPPTRLDPDSLSGWASNAGAGKV